MLAHRQSRSPGPAGLRQKRAPRSAGAARVICPTRPSRAEEFATPAIAALRGRRVVAVCRVRRNWRQAARRKARLCDRLSYGWRVPIGWAASSALITTDPAHEPQIHQLLARPSNFQPSCATETSAIASRDPGLPFNDLCHTKRGNRGVRLMCRGGCERYGVLTSGMLVTLAP